MERVNRCADCQHYWYYVCKWRHGRCKRTRKQIAGAHHACEYFKSKTTDEELAKL